MHSDTAWQEYKITDYNPRELLQDGGVVLRRMRVYICATRPSPFCFFCPSVRYMSPSIDRKNIDVDVGRQA